MRELRQYAEQLVIGVIIPLFLHRVCSIVRSGPLFRFVLGVLARVVRGGYAEHWVDSPESEHLYLP